MSLNPNTMEGAFDKVPGEVQEGIKYIVSMYHWRDGKEYNDGSRGTISISPKQLRDLLAYPMTVGEEGGDE